MSVFVCHIGAILPFFHSKSKSINNQVYNLLRRHGITNMLYICYSPNSSEYTQCLNELPVPPRHKQSCTFMPFSVQTGTYRFCAGHMRNVTQKSAPQLDLPDLSDLH